MLPFDILYRWNRFDRVHVRKMSARPRLLHPNKTIKWSIQFLGIEVIVLYCKLFVCNRNKQPILQQQHDFIAPIFERLSWEQSYTCILHAILSGFEIFGIILYSIPYEVSLSTCVCVCASTCLSGFNLASINSAATLAIGIESGRKTPLPYGS